MELLILLKLNLLCNLKGTICNSKKKSSYGERIIISAKNHIMNRVAYALDLDGIVNSTKVESVAQLKGNDL